MLVLDDVADPELLVGVDQLNEQITQLEMRGATDRLTDTWNRAHVVPLGKGDFVVLAYSL